MPTDDCVFFVCAPFHLSRDPTNEPGGTGSNFYTLLPFAFGLLFSFLAASYITRLAKKALEDAGADVVESSVEN